MTRLGAYLFAAGRERWDWGTADCCTFPADWCMALGYSDPMVGIRGTYSTEDEAVQLMRSPGLLRLFDRGLRGIGLRATTTPVSGDIGLIRRLCPNGVEAVGAIRSGERWVSRQERGLFVDEGGELVRAWAAGYYE